METKPPQDLLGNELCLGDVVCYTPERPCVGRVAAIQNGGLHTNAGQTPAIVRIIIDLTLGCPAGSQLTPLVKVVAPRQSKLIDKLLENADKLPQT